jgi:hypothetical protein
VFKDLLEAAKWITAKEKRRADRALRRKALHLFGRRSIT